MFDQLDWNGEQVGLLPRVRHRRLDVRVRVNAHVQFPTAEIIALGQHLISRRPGCGRFLVETSAACENVGERNGEGFFDVARADYLNVERALVHLAAGSHVPLTRRDQVLPGQNHGRAPARVQVLKDRHARLDEPLVAAEEEVAISEDAFGGEPVVVVVAPRRGTGARAVAHCRQRPR